MYPTKEIEELVKEEKKNPKTVIHDFGHLKRTAVGAVWFVKILGGSKNDEDLAYIAGLLHDIVRPNTEKICHAKASAERSEQILKDFKFDKETTEKIVMAVRDHRDPIPWKSPLHQSVFLADKILEQMGDYVVFRRCYYIGECVDFNKMSFKESIIGHFQHKLEKFTPQTFPERFLTLSKYQYDRVVDFFTEFSKGEKWSTDLARFFFDAGRNHNMNFEESLNNYKPTDPKGQRIKEESLKYMEGRKFPDFESMVTGV
jgi:HD superfamily phosphohydrolase YqeK